MKCGGKSLTQEWHMGSRVAGAFIFSSFLVGWGKLSESLDCLLLLLHYLQDIVLSRGRSEIPETMQITLLCYLIPLLPCGTLPTPSGD